MVLIKLLLLIPQYWFQPYHSTLSRLLFILSKLCQTQKCRYLQHLYLKFGFHLIIFSVTKQTPLKKFTTKSLSKVLHKLLYMRKKTSVTVFALVNLFCKFLVVQRPKTCLVNVWRLSRSQVAKDKVKKPHVHCEHSSCLHGSSVCVSPVYMICGLSWSGSPCDQGLKTWTALFSLWLTESHYKPQCKRFKILLTAGKQRKFL